MPKSEDFSGLVRALRSKLGLSQEQLAAKLNVSFATINRWEGGNARPQRVQLEAFRKLQDEAGLGEDGNGELFDALVAPHRQRRGVSRSTVLSNKSMEQMLWDAACS